MRLCILILASPFLAASGLLVRESIAAASPEDTCQATKITATGKHAGSLLKCYAKAAKDGTSVDPACLTKADEQLLTGFGKAEAKAAGKASQCATQGDAIATQQAVQGFVTDVVAALRPVSDGSTCAGSKIKAESAAAFSLLKAHAKYKKKPDDAMLDADVSKANTKLSGLFQKAEKKGSCLTTGDADAIQRLVDAFVARTAASLYPWLSTQAGSITISFPPTLTANGTVDAPIVNQLPSGVFLEIPVSAPGGTTTSALGIVVEANPTLSSLEQWFTDHIDPAGVLAAAQTYSAQDLGDGRRMLVFVGSLPAEYDGVELAYGYVMSRARDRVASVTSSQDHELHLVGYATAEQHEQLLRAIAQTLTFE
jgi:hypothetical protein